MKRKLADAGAKFDLAALAILLLVGGIQLVRIFDSLPTVLQDEYIYSMDSRKNPISTSDFGGFLFLAIFRVTNVCGPEFYGCVKGINVAFLVMLLFALYKLASAGMPRWVALLLATGIGLGPISIYASVFMPEMMYFALCTLGMLLAVKSLGPGAVRTGALTVSASIIFSLASLAKPHAVFVFVAVVVYVFIARRRAFSVGQRLLLLAMDLLAFLVSKIGVGYLLAGPAGVTIFGSSYTGSLRSAIGGAVAFGRGESSTPYSSEAGPLLDSTNLLLFATEHLLLSVSIVVIFIGPVFAHRIRQGFFKDQLFNLVLWVTGLMIIVSTLFAAYATAAGDDHDGRVLFRYLEFVIPLLLISGLRDYKSPRVDLTPSRATFLVGVITLDAYLLFSLFTWLPNRIWVISDSAHMFSLVQGNMGAAFWTVISAAALVFVMMGKVTSIPSLALIFAGGFAGLGILGLNYQEAQNGTPVSSDYAGLYVSENFPDIPGSRIAIIGSNQKLLEAAMFMADKPNLEFFLFPAGTRVDSELIPEQFLIVVQTLDVYLSDNSYPTYLGDGFAVTLVD